MADTDRQPSAAERDALVRGWAESLASLRGPLMPILHKVNDELGCITPQDVSVIANVLNLSVADVHGVVSFYSDFRTSPRPDAVVQVCRGEACQSVGAQRLADHATATHGDGGPAPVEVEEIFCFGNCALGPSVAVNGELHGRMTPGRLDALVASASHRPAGVPR